MKKLLLLLLLTVFSKPLAAQFVTQDWALHNVGSVIQLMNNNGRYNKLGTDYPGLINTEFPLNSYQDHLGGAGWYIGGITPEGDTLVSNTFIFGESDEFRGYSDAPWDTVWVAKRGDTLDIGDPANPYWENYVPKSDQDLVMRYNDYNEASLQLASHNPMYLDVIQSSWAWSSPPLDQFIIVNLKLVPTKMNLKKVYIGQFTNANVGRRTGSGFSFITDDYSTYNKKYRMGIGHDAPGGPDGGEYSPVGMMLIPPKNIPDDSLTWTWRWGTSDASLAVTRDPQRYDQMKSGIIQQDEQRPADTHFLQAFGPLNMQKGDTLEFKIAIVLDMDTEGVNENAKLISRLLPDFNVPSPPPTPPLHIRTENRKVILNWKARAGEIDPEKYTDTNRSDSVKYPFEGYRIYKSTNSMKGPWTLLAQFDKAGDAFGQNTGLKYEFTDSGLLNNVEYYYAVTSFSKPDTVLNFPEQYSPKVGVTSVPGTASPSDVGEVAVVPNPYRGDIDYNSTNPAWEKPPSTRERWLEQDRRLQFIHLPGNSEIKIFTLSGHLVQTLQHNNPDKGYEDWNLTSSVGQAVSSGIYLFTVKNHKTGHVQTGKFVIIK